MTCFLNCMFTLLLICMTASKAILSPPKNLMVELLDFKATAEWLPGKGNPLGTKYILEFIPTQNMSEGMWIRPPHCTNIDVQKCELAFDQSPNDLHWNYFLRVKSTFKEISSKWTISSKSFQPYGDTLLSSPGVKISADQKSININFSHLLEKNKWTKPLEYMLYLFEDNPSGESKFIALISTSKSPYIFQDVSSGKNYCVSVSVSHQQASKNNFKTTKCIYLSDSTRSFVIVFCIGATILFTFSTGILLASVCFNYARPKIKNLHIPNVLYNLGNNRVHKQPQEEPQTMMNKEDRVSMLDDESNDGSFLYLQRENLTNVIIILPSITTVDLGEQTDEFETSNQCCMYTLAVNLEQSNGSVISKNDDKLHSGSSKSLSACAGNHSKLAKVLPAITVDMFVKSEIGDRCAEETLFCSSGIDCERKEASVEEEEGEEAFLPNYSSESDYEPRSLK